MPHELSGGQQQRVQLARSLVLESDILLLDEPLASLDAKLRKDMCLELKHIQEKVGITFVHVTHNQEEAMTVADRIAIIANGRLVEEGTPREIYERPRKRFTAEFIGDNNLFQGRLSKLSQSTAEIDLGHAVVAVPVTGAGGSEGDTVAFSVRSENTHLRPASAAPATDVVCVRATYVEQVYLGLTTSHVAHLPDGTEVVARQLSGVREAQAFATGDSVMVAWAPEAARLHLE